MIRPLIFPNNNGAKKPFTLPSVDGIRDDAREHNQWMDDLVPKGSTGGAPLPAIPGNTKGMMIPGHSPGSSMWVPGSEGSATTNSMPEIPMAPQRRAPSLTDRATASDGAMRSGPLSTRGAVPVGRSGSDPTRKLGMLARRAWTRGDEGTVLDITRQQQSQQNQQDFAREMNAQGFQQHQSLLDQRQQHDAVQHEQARRDHIEMWNADKAAQAARDEQQWQNQLTMFGLNQGADAMEAERKRQQEEAERNRVPNFGQVPIQGTDYAGTYADGRPMGNVPMAKPDAPPPKGMVPAKHRSGDTTYVQPTPGKRERPQIQMIKGADGVDVPHHVRVDEKGNVTLHRIQIIDNNGDGIDDRQQMGAGDQGSLSTRPAQQQVPKTGTFPGGGSFKLKTPSGAAAARG